MSGNAPYEGSVLLRLEFSIADAVHQRGLLPVLAAALRAWWALRPRDYSEVPAHLRADLGIPEPPESAHWIYIGAQSWRFPPSDLGWQ